MIVTKEELFAILWQYNPWWDRGRVPDLPSWRRIAFHQLLSWMTDPPANRAILLSGARQVGKTTLFLQVIDELLQKKVNSQQILYLTFDHPLLKLVGLTGILEFWNEIRPQSKDPAYLFLDEIQYTKDWQTWIKHQTDFFKNRRIAATGSAIPLAEGGKESGVGRWHTIKLPTLSFYEYLKIKDIKIPELPQLSSLASVFAWPEAKRIVVGESAKSMIPHFNDYLLRGGFPQTALMDNVTLAQKLLREDIVDKVLKRDMTALYGVRRILELEKTFLYLCMHGSGILDMGTLCSNLELNKKTVGNFIDLLEGTHLIYRLPPLGYGKEILRGRYKIYLADAAIAGSVLLKGRSLLEHSGLLGAAVETAFFKHVFSRYYSTSIGFSYWRDKKKDWEVDVIAEVKGDLVPFEVKYSKSRVKIPDLKGMNAFCQERKISRAYVVTRELDDFEIVSGNQITGKKVRNKLSTRILKIPALLACFWLSQSELLQRTS